MLASSGNDLTTENPLSSARGGLLAQMRALQSGIADGALFAWNVTRASGDPILPVAKFVPRKQWSRKLRKMVCVRAPLGPVTSGPPIRAVGAARFNPSAA